MDCRTEPSHSPTPNGEADLFPDPSIDWVLFAAIVANEHVVDAGGGLI